MGLSCASMQSLESRLGSQAYTNDVEDLLNSTMDKLHVTLDRPALQRNQAGKDQANAKRDFFSGSTHRRVVEY